MKQLIGATMAVLLLAGCTQPPIPESSSIASVPPSSSSQSQPMAVPSQPPASSSEPLQAPSPSSSQPTNPPTAATALTPPEGAEHPVGPVMQSSMPVIPLADGELLELDLPITDIAQIQHLLLDDPSRLFIQYTTGETYDDKGTARPVCYLARIDINTGRVVSRFGGKALAPLVYPSPDGGNIQLIAPDAVYDLYVSLDDSRTTTRITTDDRLYRQRMAETGGVGCFPKNGGFVSVDERSFKIANIVPDDGNNAHPSDYRESFAVMLPAGCSPIRFGGSMSWVAVVTVKDGKPYLLRNAKEPPSVETYGNGFRRDIMDFAAQYPAYRITDQRLTVTLTNWNEIPLQLGRDFYLERWNDSGWAYYHYTPQAPGQLDNPPVQSPILPDESREIGVYIGGASVEQDKDFLPGVYRLTIPYGTGKNDLVQAEFRLVDSPVEHPSSGRYSMAVTTSIIKGSEDSFAFTITNHTANEAAYGLEVGLERLVGDRWQTVPLISDNSVPAIAVVLPAGKTNTESFDLKDYACPLAAGQYRIVKDMGEPLYAEFEVKP